MGAQDRQGKLIAWISVGGVIVGAFVGLYTIFHKTSKAVETYQPQVLATCKQVHDILSKDHGEVTQLAVPDPSKPDTFADPGSLITIRKDALLAVMRSNLSQVRQRFEDLDHLKTPTSRQATEQVARKAWEAWLSGAEEDVATVEANFHDGDSITSLNAISAGTQGPRGDLSVRLNSALTALAGQDCTATT